MNRFLGEISTESAQDIISSAKQAIRQAIQYDQMCYKSEKICAQGPAGAETLDHIDVALRIAPWSMRALRLKATVLLGREMYQEACAFLETSTATSSDFQLSLALARALDYNGVMDRAMSVLRSSIRRYPTHDIFKHELQRIVKLRDTKAGADSLFTSGHLEEALAQYDAGVQIDLQHKRYRSMMISHKAAVLLALGRQEEAVTELESARELCPDDTDLLTRLDRAKMQLRAKRMVRTPLYQTKWNCLTSYSNKWRIESIGRNIDKRNAFLRPEPCTKLKIEVRVKILSKIYIRNIDGSKKQQVSVMYHRNPKHLLRRLVNVFILCKNITIPWVFPTIHQSKL